MLRSEHPILSAKYVARVYVSADKMFKNLLIRTYFADETGCSHNKAYFVTPHKIFKGIKILYKNGLEHKTYRARQKRTLRTFNLCDALPFIHILFSSNLFGIAVHLKPRYFIHKQSNKARSFSKFCAWGRNPVLLTKDNCFLYF